MRKPTVAPKLDQLLKSQKFDLLEIIKKAPGALFEGRYLHWDELQYREPPGGLSREEYWFLTKLKRQASRQMVPLVDKNGEPFNYISVDPIPQRLHEIDLRLGGQVKMPEQVTNRETRDEYYVNSLIQEAITSSQLEGATTTRQVAKEMLRTGRAPRDRSERMILNNYMTMKRIAELTNEPLTKDLVFEIHGLITEGTLDDPTAAGRFRRTDEDVAVYDTLTGQKILHKPPPAPELDLRMQRLCAFANQTDGAFVHPVIRSIILHFMLAYDHPFVDGNGRTARALFYWSMRRHSYWMAEFISISHIVLKAPAKYGYAFLFTETDEGDLTYFILYHLKIITRALESLHEYIARKAAELERLELELRGIESLNHRQRSLIQHAARHPGKSYTVEEHRRSHNVSYETARSDLLDLSERGLLAAGRKGKKWVFTPERQLTGRLAAIGGRGSATLV